ncbi:MAG: amidohydrolase [Candidatus Andeanibacterium colombiense]|uniref:Amidohydrolase n=1 Tax=Candidatus Andeanibacterium colombiense TaxID=3121345 RepID=A0AAJ5X3H4_9SPHN|nr:MAG: amidohydrolase [Sphingomonadaceae bacterium]
MRKAILAIVAGALVLTGCDSGGVKSASGTPAPAPAHAASASIDDPYPSTYKPYPGAPTALVGATVYDGAGGQINNGTVLFANGTVVAVGDASLPIPDDFTRIDGTGKFVTPGVIDIHSHLGDYASPAVEANSDGNEMTSPTTPQVWAEHSVWPQDPGFSRALANGGVTSLEILPGSGNLMGGRSVTLKNVPARTVQGMKFPGAPYALKMACGENPKRVYGGKGQSPMTRMGNIAVDRQTWLDAKKFAAGDRKDRDLGKETLAGVLDGKILVQNHCYRADEMAIVIDMAKEMGYHVTAFHHAVEAYKIADLLRANNICAAVWSDWYGFKMEAYDAIPENAALLAKAGVCVIIHSDDENGIQRLNQDAARAQAAGKRMGIDIPDAQVIGWFTLNAAKAMGIDQVTGSLAHGKMADVVLWNGNPLSVYSRPEKVWIDGALMFDAMDPKRRPVSDFELGQPGEGDVK